MSLWGEYVLVGTIASDRNLTRTNLSKKKSSLVHIIEKSRDKYQGILMH